MLEFPGYQQIPEPILSFDAFDKSATAIHPLRGLIDFGPYSESVMQSQQDSIRIAAIFPEGQYKLISNLVNELKSNKQPQERKQYLPEFPGFKKVFKTNIELVEESKCLSIPTNILTFDTTKPPHLILSIALSRAISAISQYRQEFDVLYIYLPEIWSSGFVLAEENFDLHDFLKAVTATYNLPTQIIRDNAIQYKCRCSVMWRLSIALYVKAGGIPWKLTSIDEDIAIIGLSYATQLNKHTGNFDFTTCCSQIFDSDGTGLEFIAYDAVEVNSRVGENPFLNRAEMRKVMSRSLSLYQKRHAGRLPKRVVVHKTTMFKSEEIDGCFDAFSASSQIELLQIKQDTYWKGIKIKDQRNVDSYPIDRGSFLQLGYQDVLLWTQGIVNIDNKPFFKEGKGTPIPLRVIRYAGSCSWLENCEIILGLTKMNWNHDGLYDRLPVTLGYASVLATTLKRMSKLLKKPYEFKYFM